MTTRARAAGVPVWRSMLGSSGAPWLLGGPLAVATLLLGWPGLGWVWLAMAVQGLASVPPEVLPANKQPSSRETRQMSSYQKAQTTTRAALDPAGLIPSGAPTGDLVAAWCLAMLAASLPQAWVWGRLVNAAAMALVVLAVAAATRAGTTSGVPVPRSAWAHLCRAWRGKKTSLIIGAVFGLLGGAGLALVGLVRAAAGLPAKFRDWFWAAVDAGGIIPEWATRPADQPGWLVLAAAAVTGTLVGAWPSWRAQTRRLYPLLIDSHQRWSKVWEKQKIIPAPTIDSVDEIIVGGQVVGFVETIKLSQQSARGAAMVVMMADTLRADYGDTSHEMVVLPHVAVDQDTGQPVQGQRSATLFRVAHFTAEKRPSLLDVAAEESPAATLLVECAAATGGGGFTPPMVESMTRMSHTVPAWLVSVSDSWGDGWSTVRSALAPHMAGWLGCQVLADTGPKLNKVGLPPRLYVGDLSQPHDAYDTSVAPVPDGHQTDRRLPATFEQYFQNLAAEDTWAAAWRACLSKPDIPLLAHSRSGVKQLSTTHGMIKISCATFVVARGLDPEKNIFPAEPKLRTVVRPQAANLTAAWLAADSSAPPGARNQIGVQVISTTVPLPAPHEFPPQNDTRGDDPETAERWAWRCWVNAAFDAVKLPRPEIMGQRCLTGPESQEHLWQINLKLYDGVTVKKLTMPAVVDGMRAATRAPWLSVADLPDGDALLLIGADPVPAHGETPSITDQTWATGAEPDDGERRWPRRRGPRVSMPVANHVRVEDILFRTWWADAGVVSPAGARPQLLGSEPVPTNPLVTRRVFKMPSGVGLPNLRAAAGKLRASSGNQFIDVRPDPSDASQAVVLFARDDPMPRYAAYDFTTESTPKSVPFGVRADGSAMTVDLGKFTHLLLTGTAGSGKSASSLAPFVSLIRAGCQMHVIDYSVKQAADYLFAEPWLSTVSTSEAHAQAVLEASMAEISRRVDLYKSFGAADIGGIPEPHRPPHVCIVVDEASEALKIPDKPSAKPEASPDLERARLDQIKSHAVRSGIARRLDTIAATGRSSGYHLLLISQAMKATSLPDCAPNLKTNVSMCLLGSATPGQRMSGLINPDTAPDPGENVPQGRGVWDPRQGSPELVQFWHATTSDYAGFLAAHVPPREPMDVSGFIPSEADLVGFSIQATPSTPSTPDPADVENVSWDDLGLDLAGLLPQDDPTGPLPLDQRSAPAEPGAPEQPDAGPVPVLEAVVGGQPQAPDWESVIDWSDTDPVPEPVVADDTDAVLVEPSQAPPPARFRPRPVSMLDIIG